jgi:hypothetical protein
VKYGSGRRQFRSSLCVIQILNNSVGIVSGTELVGKQASPAGGIQLNYDIGAYESSLRHWFLEIGILSSDWILMETKPESNPPR